MSYRLFVHVRGGREQDVVSFNVAYDSAETLGKMADALSAIGLSASIYPEPEVSEARFVMPKVEPAVRTVLLALIGWAEEQSDADVGEAARGALRHLDSLAREGRERANRDRSDKATVTDTKPGPPQAPMGRDRRHA